MSDPQMWLAQRLQMLQFPTTETGVSAGIATTNPTLAAAPPPPARPFIDVYVYPQDPFIGEPEVRQMAASDLQLGLFNDRLQLEDPTAPLAQPDAQGNYLFPPQQPAFNQINAFYYANFTLRMWERYAGRSLPWAFKQPKLTINPRAGTGINAFYNEINALLGFHSQENQERTIHAAQSADVVSHETAHAVLDGLRDYYNESFGLVPTAFHESFSDITAMLVALHDDTLVRRLLEWTNGNLRVDNFITRLAEELSQPDNGRSIYLRNALNDLKQQPFDALPYQAAQPAIELGRESHNYSRLFTGAAHDLLVRLYDAHSAELGQHLALLAARDVVARLLIYAVELAPVGEFDYRDMAQAFLTADQLLWHGEHQTSLIETFTLRGILSPIEAQAHLQALANLPELKLSTPLTSADDAIRWLHAHRAALNLPAAEQFAFVDIRPFGEGYTALTFSTRTQQKLSGQQYAQYNQSVLTVFGGLTLSFNAENQLTSCTYRPVGEEDKRQIQVMALEYVQQERILSGGQVHHKMPLHYWFRTRPKGILTRLAHSSTVQLIRFPVLFDWLKQPEENFQHYLQAWAEVLHHEG